MKTIRFRIDEKSLFYGIYNDFERGQTATVHTPINQAKDPKDWHQDIIELTKHNIELKKVPEMLEKMCLRNTTSQAKSKLNQFFEFKNLLLDGEPLECFCSFGMYIKEEVDKNIVSRRGIVSPKTHFGRQKLHYPISLNYQIDGMKIDNKRVLQTILDKNGGFAFVVREFEYCIEKDTLNFITSMVGPQNIPLSNVFRRAKGVGKKLLLGEIDVNDFEILNEVYTINKNLKDKDIQSVFELANKTKVENGKLGEEIILEMLKKNPKITDIYHTSKVYPTSPYDIEFYENGVKKYIEVKSTQTSKKVFNMSIGELKFMDQYSKDYKLYLVTNVRDSRPGITSFVSEEIKKLRYEHPTTRFYA